IAAPLGMRGKPAHVAVAAFGEEARERVLGLRDRVGPRHRDRIEAAEPRLFDQRSLDGGRIGQKSRSAYVFDGGAPAWVSPSSGRNAGRDFTRAYQFFAASFSFHGTSPR